MEGSTRKEAPIKDKECGRKRFMEKSDSVGGAEKKQLRKGEEQDSNEQKNQRTHRFRKCESRRTRDEKHSREDAGGQRPGSRERFVMQ